MSFHIDYSQRPQNVSKSQWKALTSEQRDAALSRHRSKQRDEAAAFEAHMMYDSLSTKEMTWLRDRIMNLEYRLNSQPSSDNP